MKLSIYVMKIMFISIIGLKCMNTKKYVWEQGFLIYTKI
jgi:hypothetical protein